MNRDETVALFLQGREAWNAWAEKMLAERKALEEAGRWAAERDRLGMLVPKNDDTDTWMKMAKADFSRCCFLTRESEDAEENGGEVKGKREERKTFAKSIVINDDKVDFFGFVFQGGASFNGAAFKGHALFSGATFSGDTAFNGVTFSERALFIDASFLGTSSFFASIFAGDTWFEGTTFSGAASFERATFSREAWFRHAAFSDATWPTWFMNVTFLGVAYFEDAVFAGAILFTGTSFADATTFAGTKFLHDVSFTGIKAERLFDLTGGVFCRMPTFNQADFKQAPDLDDVRFPLPGFWRGGNAKLVAQYRALRRMAIQGADYEREQMAYKGELRARRWTVDKWWSIGTWIGLFYDAFADCGRSIVRPANAWLVSIFLFAAFYWQRAAGMIEAQCMEAGGQALQALFLSVKNALVIFGGTRDARVNQAYLCLYNGSEAQPHIPPTVTFVETLAQIPVSATLIFLFLLAVKNRFKIK